MNPADMPKAGPLVYSDHVEGHGPEFFAKAEQLKLEGIVSKRADAPYRSDRTKNWLKVKTGHGQEFPPEVIVGNEESAPVGAAPLGLPDQDLEVGRLKARRIGGRKQVIDIVRGAPDFLHGCAQLGS